MTGGSEQWEGGFDKHHVLCSIYLRAIKGGSGHNDVWRTAAEVGGGAVRRHKHERRHRLCTYRVSRFNSPAKQLSPMCLILLLWRCLEKQKQITYLSVKWWKNLSRSRWCFNPCDLWNHVLVLYVYNEEGFSCPTQGLFLPVYLVMFILSLQQYRSTCVSVWVCVCVNV